MQGLICSGIEDSFVTVFSTGFRSKGECDSTSSAAKRQGNAVGSNRLSATWSSGGEDRALPVPGQLANGDGAVGPPHRQLAVRQRNLHHNFARVVITLPPIPTRLRGWNRQSLQPALSLSKL